MTILAIFGLKRAGKDTLAHVISQKLTDSGRTFEFVAFADALREVCSIAFGIPIQNFVADELKDVPHDSLPNRMTPRDALILVGTELFRKQVASDIWVRAAVARIQRSTADFVIVTDVRFENELRALKDNFDTRTFLVVRDSVSVDPDGDMHETERFAAINSAAVQRRCARSVFPFDYIFFNNDTLSKLANTVSTAFVV